jgi:two-component sensor histidine kinase
VPDEWVGTMTDVHDLRSLQERQKVLMAELQHRTRNVLAVAHAIAIQTLRSSDSLDAFRREFEKRLQALSRVQGVIASLDYGNVDLHDLLAAELQAYEGWNAVTNRVTVEGPAVALPPPAAQALGLAVHELVTNAAKYGALSDEAGRLAVTWRLRRNEAGRLQAELDWKESGVKIAAEGDRRRGYGRELIERALPYQLGAETKLTFEPDGVHCTTVIEIEEEESEEAKGG